MSLLWLLLIVAVTAGNLALGFGLACLFGHGPKLPHVQLQRIALSSFKVPNVRSLLDAARAFPHRLLAIIRSRKSPQSPP